MKTTVEAAAIDGFRCRNISSHICLGKVVVMPLEINKAMVSSSKEMLKANKKAAIRPSRSNGIVMKRNIESGLAPSVAAA